LLNGGQGGEEKKGSTPHNQFSTLEVKAKDARMLVCRKGAGRDVHYFKEDEILIGEATEGGGAKEKSFPSLLMGPLSRFGGPFSLNRDLFYKTTLWRGKGSTLTTVSDFYSPH